MLNDTTKTLSEIILQLDQKVYNKKKPKRPPVTLSEVFLSLFAKWAVVKKTQKNQHLLVYKTVQARAK
jgi:hypothetical protein